MSESGGKEYFMIAGAAVLWGTVGVFLRWVDLPGQEYFVVFMRAMISICFLTVVIYAGGKQDQLRPGKHPFLLFLSGAVLTFHWVMFMKALNNLSIGDAEFITYLAPVLVAILAPLVLKEKLEGITVIALLLALAGMYFISLTGQAGEGGLKGAGLVYALTAAVTYAFLLIILKKLREDTPTLTVTFYQTAINAALLFPFCAFRYFPVSTQGWASLIILGTVHTAFAGLVYIYAVKKVKAQHVGIIAYLEPLSAVVFGAIFLGEHPGWQDLVGGILIIVAGALVLRKGVRE
ncbi:MAG: DMT family transporter [Actinomycetota bacterium]